MVAPYPYDSVAGRVALSQRAKEIESNYGWIARLTEEITVEPTINLVKLSQLAFTHCRGFRDLWDAYGGNAREAIQQRFAGNSTTWATRAAMVADLQAIRDQGRLLFIFVRDNVPEARRPSELVKDPNADGGTDEAKTLSKPHPVEAEIALLRALFGAVLPA